MEPDEYISLSALQHYAYCPRQCGLIHLEQVWDENIFTLRGRRAHERVHMPREAMREGVRIEYALPVWSDRQGLVGICDVVEFEPDGTPYPVEHKVGPRRAARADAVQLCAQALCLEEMLGVAVPCGAIYHHKSRRRREVAFERGLRSEVAVIVEAVRTMLRSERLPAPQADARCRRCSLRDACLPLAVHRLQHGTEET